MPQLIVQVQTTLANVQDVEVTAPIQEDLARHESRARRPGRGYGLR